MKRAFLPGVWLALSVLTGGPLEAQTHAVTIRKVTTAQRNRLKNPPHGMVVLNIDSMTYEVYDTAMGGWKGMGAKNRPPYKVGPRFCEMIGEGGADELIGGVSLPMGGYVLVGNRKDGRWGGDDVWIARMNAKGNITAAWAMGAAADDRARDVTMTPGTVIIGGASQSFSDRGEWDGWVASVTLEGQIQWATALGTPHDEECYGVAKGKDGRVYAVGYVKDGPLGAEDVWLVQLDGEGRLRWSRAVGGTGSDYALGCAPAPDGGVIVVGGSYSFGAGGEDVYIAYVDSGGALRWTITVGGPKDEHATAVASTSDGGWMVAGFSNSYGKGATDVLVIKVSAHGSVEWTRTLGGEGYDEAADVIEVADGGYAVAGFSASGKGATDDGMLFYLNRRGILKWTKGMGSDDGDDYARMLLPTIDEGLLVGVSAGSFRNDEDRILIVKTTRQGLSCGDCEQSLDLMKGVGNAVFSIGSGGQIVAVGALQARRVSFSIGRRPVPAEPVCPPRY